MRTWRVVDVMTVDVVTVREDTPYRDIVDNLQEYRVSAAPVIDADGQVVGVVSEADLLHKIERVGEEHERRIFASRRHKEAQAKAHAITARDLMTAPAVTITPETPLIAAAKRLDEARVKRLPVVDEEGRLVGIVARSDLLRVYLRPDREIAEEVREDVLRRTLWVEPGQVEVAVRDGVVTLSGRVDRSSTVRLAVKFTQSVAGVVDVVDRLGFEFDDRKLADASHYGPNPWGMP